MAPDATTLRLPERLTHQEAAACLADMQARAAGQGPVVVDAGALRDFDSAALSTLLALRRWAQAQGRALQLRQLPPRLAELVSLYGVGELLAA